MDITRVFGTRVPGSIPGEGTRKENYKGLETVSPRPQKEQAQSEVVNLKNQLPQIEAKLQKLLDVYLNDALTQQEYAAKKAHLFLKRSH